MKKNSTSIVITFFIVGILFWVFYSMIPQNISNNQALSEFSTKRVLKTIEKIAQKPHYVGSENHEEVVEYIVSEIEKMGLKASIQEEASFYDGVGTQPKNIFVRIPGSGSDKDLMLLAHYDSAPHSYSHGATDDASGVATILEGIRVFLHNKTPHKNDIVVLFSDAEELGLNGAALFAKKYSKIQEVGLILNFEARGSSGSSFMLMESNSGNQRMINDFVNANPKFPVSNSLMYSIYKMLPNDTDLTAFRKIRNIQGFNFANIDSHFNYHTQQDNFENTDEASLAHKAGYLMPLMKHFSNFDLKMLTSSRENVYCNTPFGFINYSFDYIFPMLILAVILFLVLIFTGIKRKLIIAKEIFKGFIPLFLGIILAGGLTFLGWKLLLVLYPQYNDIPQGFTYNGHDYMMAFVFFSLSICFLMYNRLKVENSMSHFIGPLLFWMVINLGVAFKLQGASFFILPVFSGLAMLAVYIFTLKNYWFLNIILALPTLILVVPFIHLFPIGLGLKIMFGSAILVVLCFTLLLPLFGNYIDKEKWAVLFGVFVLFFVIKAHLNSDYSNTNKKPNSLVYFFDHDKNKSYFATYDLKIDEWTSQFLTKNPKKATEINKALPYSKYNSGFSFMTDAPNQNLKKSEVAFYTDTLVYSEKLKKNMRWIQLEVTPSFGQTINRYDFFIDKKVDIYNVAYFDSDDYRTNYSKYERTENQFFRSYPVNDRPINFKFEVDPNEKFDLGILESSFDLLNNLETSKSKRSDYMMPKPFVINDARMLKQTFRIEKYDKN
ncbi:M28 family peptidase [Flavobacterium sp.]|uniref:M28 family peptidase n=1 Tax=Flavobacterium sp. TaxID=239 RepID=UPI0037531510